ncbi:MAG TPA: NAD-dependent epimerase/dehydratase family protein, partial [Pyrinomonadaceae bacterium]|nr:NAD-dependent epimerase/dehydratase family protein [Pyrinomonadaceae bacterium]
MRILVTGGSGYLGVHVRRFFAADDFSRRSSLDILAPYDLEKISNYDVVIHLAAHLNKDPADSESCFRVNAEGTANVIRHMKPHSVLIYASTKDVYGIHADSFKEVPETCSVDYCGQTALEWSKLMGERYLEYYAREREIRACIFRLSTVYARPSEGTEYGFVTHYVESVKYRRPIELPLKGRPVRDILHVEDLCRACETFIASSRSFGLYNLGGGKNNSASLRDIVERVGQMIQLEPIIEDDLDLPPGVPINYVSDIGRVREELQWEPTVGIDA